MTLPTLDKTWQFYHGTITGGSYAISNRQMFWQAKNAMITFASSPWLVWGSSNSVAYGNNDGVDRWVTDSNVVWGYIGQAHSWIVLRQPGMSNAMVCLDAYGFSGLFTYWSIMFLPTGPTVDGSLTMRPQAPADEFGFDRYGYLGPTDASWTGYSHVLQSTDGQVTRVVTCRSGVNPGFWNFELAKNPITAWSPAATMWCAGSNSNADTATYAQLCSSHDRTMSRISTALANLYMGSEGFGASSVGQQMTFPDDDTSEYCMLPADFISDTTPTRGVKGRAYDLWWASTATATGDTYPGDGSNAFAQFSDLIVPWDGTVPGIT